MTWLFCPDAILDKASRAKDVQPSRRQTPLSGHLGLNMEIACSRSATVRMLGQQCPDAALFRKEYERIWKAGCIVVLSDALSYLPDAA
jgi:hypothetical protein